MKLCAANDTFRQEIDDGKATWKILPHSQWLVTRRAFSPIPQLDSFKLAVKRQCKLAPTSLLFIRQFVVAHVQWRHSEWRTWIRTSNTVEGITHTEWITPQTEAFANAFSASWAFEHLQSNRHIRIILHSCRIWTPYFAWLFSQNRRFLSNLHHI
jgi:hypothetical protein